MAVGVRDDQVAALADKVLGCVGGDAALSDLILPDDLVIGHAQLGGSFLDAVDERIPAQLQRCLGGDVQAGTGRHIIPG